jgi:general secretion pathway protein D
MNVNYVGDAFTYKDQQIQKTELVIFLRPRVITNASVDGELSDFQRYMPGNLNRTSRDLREAGEGP